MCELEGPLPYDSLICSHLGFADIVNNCHVFSDRRLLHINENSECKVTSQK